MKRLSIKRCATIVGLAASLFMSQAAHAIPLSNTPVTQAFVSSIVTGTAAPLLTSGFDYEPGLIGQDGVVNSIVFTTSIAGGEFLYLYQIEHFATSSENKVGGITLDFAPLGLSPTSIQIVDGGGDRAVTSAIYDGQAVTFLFNPDPASPDSLTPGHTSVFFGVFSPINPGIVVSDVLDGGLTLASASVYSPVPEPASLLLLGSGLSGIGLLRWNRSKKA